jgi:small ligand-binding sensory domain FIST
VALDHLRGHEAELGEQIEAELGPLCERDLLLVSCDAHDVEPSALAAGLGACAPAAVLGLGVEGCGGARAAHFAGSEIRTEGALAVRLRAPLAVAVCIAAGTRPLASRSVTLARGHWVISIDGRPALDAFREAAGALSEDPRRASRSVFAYVEGALSGSSCAGAVVGFDEAEGTIGLSLAVSTGDRIVFAQRDPLAARSALAAAAGELAAAAPPAPGQLGLATTSRTRGPALFGQPGIESGYLSSGFPAADWLGLVGSFQIVASPQLPPRLLNLSSVLARLF